MDLFSRYMKVTVPTKSIVASDLGRDRIDGQIAACVLQGIVNRENDKKIYVMNTYCYDNNRGGYTQVQIAEQFLKILFNDIPVEKLQPVNDREWPGFLALLDKFEKFVKGIIIWDPKLEQATIEAATTIAAQTDSLVVSPELAEALIHKSFNVTLDLRKFEFKNNVECLDWLLKNWFRGACKDIAFTWSHMTTDGQSWGAANKDYVVAMKLFTYYLDITDKEESKGYFDVLKHYPQGTAIMGWTDERWSDALFAKMGYFMVPYISVENLTIHSSFPSTTGVQSQPKPAEIFQNGVYIAMFVADGDNLLHSMVYEPNTIINSAAYNKIPMTWILNPGMVDLAPQLFDWYYKNIGKQEFGAMLSDGHPHSDRYLAFKRYCNFCDYYLKKAGMYTLKQMEESEAVGWNIQPYVMNSGYAGTCPKGIREYEYHMDGETFHIGSVKLTNGAKTIRDLVKNAPQQGQPLFLNVFCGTAIVDLPQIVESVVKELKKSEIEDGVHYFFLRSMDMAATYRKWKGLSLLPKK
jgi:hypothetical protein